MVYKKILLTFFSLLFLIGTVNWGVCQEKLKIDRELYYPSPQDKSKYYIVEAGDTFSIIAYKFYGTEDKWRDIWALNAWVQNPDNLKIGWKLLVTTKSDVPVGNYRDSMRIDLVKKAFHIRKLTYVSKDKLVDQARHQHFLLKIYDFNYIPPHQFIVRTTEFMQIMKKLEIYDVIDSIMIVTQNCAWWDMPYLLLASAWQESYLINRDGKHGEKGYWQWRVSSAKLLRPNISEEDLAYKLEFDTVFAAQITFDHMIELYKTYGRWRRVLKRYNGTGEAADLYANQSVKKFHALKRMKVK